MTTGQGAGAFKNTRRLPASSPPEPLALRRPGPGHGSVPAGGGGRRRGSRTHDPPGEAARRWPSTSPGMSTGRHRRPARERGRHQRRRSAAGTSGSTAQAPSRPACTSSARRRTCRRCSTSSRPGPRSTPAPGSPSPRASPSPRSPTWWASSRAGRPTLQDGRRPRGTVRSQFQPAGTTSLEGFLLPETYFVEAKDDETKILERMVEAFDSLAVARPRGGVARLGVTPYQMIGGVPHRAEARVQEDRGKIGRDDPQPAGTRFRCGSTPR